MQVFNYESVASTQDLAKQYAKRGRNEAAAFISNQQTAAYGQKGRSFYAPANSGLYLSLVLPKFSLNPNKAGLLTPFIALKLVETLQKFYPGADFKIKWVNDLYLNGKKVAGILTEIYEHKLIIGVGINLNTSNFPRELKEKAGRIADQVVDRAALTQAVIQALLFASQKYDQEDFLEKYRSLSNLLDKEVVLQVGKQEIKGRVTGFNEQGMILEVAGKRQVFASGEVEKVNF